MPGKARGTHVPGAPLKGLQSARAPGVPRGLHRAAEGWSPRSGLRAPGLGVRFFVPAHARPILTDGVRGSPAANRRARLASSAPSGLGAPPLRLPTWSGPALLARSSGAVPWVASTAIAGPRSPPLSAPLVARCRQRPGCCWAFGSPRLAGGAALLASKAEPVVASGREMVVVSVPAEVTVILLDIEGTTTPIAFVKVRGGRERGSYLCLKASEREILRVAGFCPRGSGEVVWFSVSGMGEERLRRFAGVLFLAPPSSPRSLLSVRRRRMGRSGCDLSRGLGRGKSAGRSWGDWSALGLAGRCVTRWVSVRHVPKVAARRGSGLDLVVLEV